MEPRTLIVEGFLNRMLLNRFFNQYDISVSMEEYSVLKQDVRPIVLLFYMWHNPPSSKQARSRLRALEGRFGFNFYTHNLFSIRRFLIF